MRAQSVRWRIARRHLNSRRPRRLRWFVAGVLALFLLSGGASAAGAMYFASQLPPASRFHIQYAFQDARIYDAQGDLLTDMSNLRTKSGGTRIVEPLQALRDRGDPCRGRVDRIPLLLQNATIATEDATFYKNPGFDAFSILRAAYQNWRYGHIVSGASTITQQLVRSNMLNGERTFKRKAQEVALAYEITRRFSKRKILWYYLNSVYYGNLAYGAQAAAQLYFSEPVCRLDEAQAALLAGLPRGPSVYDPVRYPAAALARMKTVLDLMHKHGYLRSRAEMQRDLQEASRWRFSLPKSHMRYPQFLQYAVGQLMQIPRLRGELYKGIDVYTTLNPRVQDLAQGTVTQQIDSLSAQHVTNGALVSLDLRPHHYGWILAMVGSAHYTDRTGQINMADTPRQPGSSIKPFNYIWAFSHGAGPGTLVTDSPISLPDPNNPQDGGMYQPVNYDHRWHGTLPLRVALDNSLNVPAVKVEYALTHPDHVAQTAKSFGMSSIYRDNPGLDCSVCYALTLGGLARGTRLVEETAAYGAFATGGWTVPPVAIWKVVRRSDHRVLFCSSDCPPGVHPDSWITPRAHVIDSQHAYEMTDVLSDNNARCTPQVCEFGQISPLVLDRPAAAKTGTTSDWTDNWTLGYTPQIVTGVWTGNPDHSSMINVTGIVGAAPIWHDFMESAFSLLNLPPEAFAQPPGLIRSAQCSGGSYGTIDLEVQGAPPPLCSIPNPAGSPSCSPYGTYGSYPCPGYNPYPSNTGAVTPYYPAVPQPVAPPAQPAPVQPAPVQPVQPAPQPANPQPPAAQPPAAQPPPTTSQHGRPSTGSGSGSSSQPP